MKEWVVITSHNDTYVDDFDTEDEARAEFDAIKERWPYVVLAHVLDQGRGEL